MLDPRRKYALSAIWWFYLPWLFFISLAVLHNVNPSAYKNYIDGEIGFLEIFHSCIIFLAFLASLPLLKECIKKGEKLLTVWVGIACLSCLYIFLEEISYGQHFFGWEASEYWQEVNDQQETNLHNTSSWFDQKPRLLLEIGVIVGGIIMPLLKKFAPKTLPEKFSIIYPSSALFSVALIAEITHLSDYLMPADKGIALFARTSEMQETAYFYFVLLYLMMLRIRLAIKLPQKKSS